MNPDQLTETLKRALKLCDDGNLDEGERLCQQIIEHAPELAVAQHLMGLIQLKSGREVRALAYFTKAVALNPQYAQGHYDLAITQHALGELERAQASFEKTLELDPGHGDALNNLGNVRKDLGDLKGATALYERAVAINPNAVDALHNLGSAYRHLGRIDDAIAFYRKTLAVNPADAETHRNLSAAVKHVEYDDEVRAMEDQLARDDIADEDRMNLSFGLGKAYEELSRFDDAFRHLETANRLMRSSMPYDITEDQNVFERIKAVFVPALFQRLEGGGNKSEKPIFVLGMPRSGTSLVEQILASHPRVAGGGELPDLTDVAKVTCVKEGGEEFPECVENLSVSQLGKLGALYLDGLSAHNLEADGDFITDKMPHNFMLIGLIRLILPKAKIIHCVRDPMDTCLSIFKNYFASGHAYAYDMADLGRYYGLYRDMMAHWEAVTPGAVVPLIYEDMVNDQENQTRKLLAHCGLEWDDACLAFHKTRRDVKTASASQVRRPLYKDSVKLWQRYEQQLKALQKALAGN